MFDKQEAM